MGSVWLSARAEQRRMRAASRGAPRKLLIVNYLNGCFFLFVLIEVRCVGVGACAVRRAVCAHTPNPNLANKKKRDVGARVL
jgi:hypothetical protein